jgi:hypothetical protein
MIGGGETLVAAANESIFALCIFGQGLPAGDSVTKLPSLNRLFGRVCT